MENIQRSTRKLYNSFLKVIIKEFILSRKQKSKQLNGLFFIGYQSIHIHWMVLHSEVQINSMAL